MKLLTSIVPKGLLSSTRATRRIITNFAESSGMVYFGYVSQRDDEHHIVRGMTVSTKHVDDHYCIGTYEGYDIVFVERTDTLPSKRKHVWHILEIDLRSKADIPHLFVSSSKPSSHFFDLLSTKYPAMHPVTLGSIAPYSADFTAKFTVYATPAHAIDAESLLPPEIAPVLLKHAKGLAFEVNDQSLYVYSEYPHLTNDILQAMLSNGVWLASQIDKNSQLT